jgi:hypothetical protein
MAQNGWPIAFRHHVIEQYKLRCLTLDSQNCCLARGGLNNAMTGRGHMHTNNPPEYLVVVCD